LTAPRPEITRLDVGEFTFPDDEAWPGETGVVVAYLIRHPDAIVLFDTGLGLGESELDARYHPCPRPIADVLAAERLGIGDIDVVVNCHLHADHAGQNVAFTGVPIYVQPAEREAARDADYTVTERVDGPGVEYRLVAGDHELVPGVRIVATPGYRRSTAPASGPAATAHARADRWRAIRPCTTVRSNDCGRSILSVSGSATTARRG
jgi:glyoxylase-like metal-dependent hydrolase (beta-lactamase superfamily II)